MSESPEPVVLLSHGGGGRRTRQLIEAIICPPIANSLLAQMDDGTCLTVPEPDLVLTTDSYVVHPLFFPGGDIGRLAVCGTVNDLAMQGAEPRYLSLGLILEEGLPIRDLDRIMKSLGATAREAGVQIVTGDTKVVERGRGNGVFINTTGLGIRRPGVDTRVANARPGDVMIVTGTLGDHGMAIMSVREGLQFQTALLSDVMPLGGLIGAVLDAMPRIHCLRDPTRGGLAAAANDIAEASGVTLRLAEAAIPIRPDVRGACGLLGLDPLNVANEGKAVILCDPMDAEEVLAVLRSRPEGAQAAVIGRATDEPGSRVLLETTMGGERIVDVPMGEDLPRIC